MQTGELADAFVTYEQLESKRPLKGDHHKLRDQNTEELELQVISSPLANGHGHREEHQGLLREGNGKQHADVAATGAALKHRHPQGAAGREPRREAGGTGHPRAPLNAVAKDWRWGRHMAAALL